jgi:hypothetical protein
MWIDVRFIRDDQLLISRCPSAADAPKELRSLSVSDSFYVVDKTGAVLTVSQIEARASKEEPRGSRLHLT